MSGHGHEEEHADGHGHDAHHGGQTHGGDDKGHSGGSFGHRVGNLAATPVRAVGTVGYAALDLTKTLAIEPAKNIYQIGSDSIDDVNKLFQEAGKRGKRYHKALNIPLAGALTGVKAVEGACRGVINPLWNALHNTFNVAKGGVKNAYRTLTSVFSKKPMSDFSFEHLKTKPTWKTWDLTKFLVGGKGDSHDNHGHTDHAGHGSGHEVAHTTPAAVPVPIPAPAPAVDMSPINTTLDQHKSDIAKLSQQLIDQDKKHAEAQKSLIKANTAMHSELADIKKLLATSLGSPKGEENKEKAPHGKKEKSHEHKEKEDHEDKIEDKHIAKDKDTSHAHDEKKEVADYPH